jgi:hypothetical protein
VARLVCCFVSLAVVAALPGCRFVDHEKLSGKSPLAPLETTPSQVALEVVFLRLVGPDAEIDETVWQEVDEQSLAAESRRRLASNGFRAGVVGKRLPDELARLINNVRLADGSAATVQADPGQTIATRQWMFLDPGQRGEIVASAVQPECHVLHVEHGEVLGKTYQNGQAEFGVSVASTDGGRSAVKLVPEVHHGAFRQRYVRGEGMFQLDTSRQKEIFDRLAIDAPLSPGETLVISSVAEKRGSLGHRFFNEKIAEKRAAKMLFIRWAEPGQEALSPFNALARQEPNPATEPADGVPAADQD